MMLQKRVSGDAIGFSVLGIFVVNKTTTLSVIQSFQFTALHIVLTDTFEYEKSKKKHQLKVTG